ncbi:hypothetical protein [Halobellus ordinarius]|uniref:DUF7857 domain-containing protein n=1 Tax=Halobellus ordinarius TaxID=3075120 RepID=UPI0028801A57|nr:hypothetical protein [Halobellus sp. ZY16]
MLSDPRTQSIAENGRGGTSSEQELRGTSPEHEFRGTANGDSATPVRETVSTTAVGGVTLVRVELHSDVSVALAVRITNELDGPVLPPRREGVPAAGWDGDGFYGAIPAEGHLGVGYACPTPNDAQRDGDTSENPAAVSVELLGPADSEECDSDRIAAAVRSLGRAGPPADAVPTTAGDGRGRGAELETAAEGIVEEVERSGSESDALQTADDASNANHDTIRNDVPRRPGDSDGDDDPDLPPAIDRWLAEVETRVEHAEGLTDASASEAAATLEAGGGLDALADLPESLAWDLDALRALAERIDDLEARATAADPEPVLSALSNASAPVESEAASADTPETTGRR